MNDDEIVKAEDTETQQEEAIDETEDDLDEGEGTEPAPEETTEQLRARLAESEDKRKRLFARLQREKNKPAPAKPAPAPSKAEIPTGLSREEGILFSKGFEDDEVEYAQKVAMLQGVKLTEAVKDPLFTTWKSNKDAETKKQQAQLGTSKGARTTVKKSIDSPGLSEEEHKAMFKEIVG
jgi:hypothetical protein